MNDFYEEIEEREQQGVLIRVREAKNQAQKELDWLKSTATDSKDNCRIIGFEDCLRIFLPHLADLQQFIDGVPDYDEAISNSQEGGMNIAKAAKHLNDGVRDE